MNKKAELKVYCEGMRDAIRRFAWWKDGVQYVGCGVFTLEQALAIVDDVERIGMVEEV